jgi:hypothetical protein
MAAYFKDSSQLYTDRAHIHTKKKKDEMNHFFLSCCFIIPERMNKYDKKAIILVEREKCLGLFHLFFFLPKRIIVFLCYL